MLPLSVLDLAPIVAGGDARTALANTRDLAQHCERWGYHRYWLAEHHGMPGVASAATAIVIGHVAAATSHIRVGAAGIMLPNHAPLIIAEQFGTLEALFPGRIDLGLGRAPGSDPITQRALRRRGDESERFTDDVLELMAWLEPAEPDQRVIAVPGAGLRMPIWILGSSLFGAQLAAELGLPFAFASHFAPALLDEALAIYRGRYRPSEAHPKPLAMAGLHAIAADTDAEAEYLASSLQQAFLQLRRGQPGPLPAPIAGFAERMRPEERAVLAQALSCSVVGSPARITAGLSAFRERTRADELFVSSPVFDHAARLRSFQLIAEAARGMPPSPCSE